MEHSINHPGAGRQLGEVMKARRHAELEQQFKPCVLLVLVPEQFRDETLKCIEQQRGPWHCGQTFREAAEAKAERLIKQALQTDHVTEQQLASWRKGHPFKIGFAATLRAQATVTASRLAKRLRMGSRGHLGHLLLTHARAQTKSPNQTELRI